jgi:hypothetical protein
MTLTDLLSKLRKEDIFPIQVEALPEHSNDLAFVGSLSEYIEAAKALQSTVIFVSTITLSNEHFLSYDPDTDDETDHDERVDLCRIVPGLKDYMSRIGQDGHIDLSVSLSNGSLTLTIVEDWMVAFVEIRSQAQELLRQASLEKHALEEAAEEASRQHLLRNLRGLIKDEDFVRLPTQRAMLAYALYDFPELESLEKSVLKVEIQNLKARIDAQGLRRK